MASARATTIAVYALLCVVWGTTWSVIVVGLREVPPVSGVAIRFLIAGLLLWALARIRGVALGRRPGERALWVVNAILSFCISYGIVYWGEQWVPSGMAAVLFATYPLFVAVLAHFFLPGERMGWRDGLGALVGFAGVAVLFASDFGRLGGEPVRRAALVMLVSPFASAIASVAVKRWGAGIHPLSLTAPPMVMTGLVMGALAAWAEEPLAIEWTGEAIGALLYLAVAGSAVTFTLYYWLLARMQARRVALIAFIIPVVAVAIGTFLGEPVTRETVAGSLLVVVGVALAVVRR